MATLIERIRSRYPEYGNVPDDRILMAVARRYPEYVAAFGAKAWQVVLEELAAEIAGIRTDLADMKAEDQQETEPLSLAGVESRLDEVTSKLAVLASAPKQPAPAQDRLEVPPLKMPVHKSWHFTINRNQEDKITSIDAKPSGIL